MPFQTHAIRYGAVIQSVLVGLSIASLANASNDVWDANGAIPPHGVWGVGANWADNTTPGMNDGATFNLPSTYVVSVTTDPAAIQALTVSMGVVALASSGGVQTLDVTSASGTRDVTVSGPGILQLGTPNNPLHVNIGDELSIQGGGVLQARFGSQLVATGLSGTGLNGVLSIDGVGSILALNGAGEHRVGTTAGNNALVLTNGSTGSAAGSLGVVDTTVADATGTISVQSGSALELAGDLSVGAEGATGQVARVEIKGTGSALTQTGASSITVGALIKGTATIEIGATADGGTLTTGTGTLTINRTGKVTVASGTNFGRLNANGNVTIDGGILEVGDYDGFYLAPFRTLRIQNGGRADFDSSSYYANDKAKYVVTGVGSTWNHSGHLILGGFGENDLTIGSGGSVSSKSGTIGGGAGGEKKGTVTVQGADSVWNIREFLGVGEGLITGTGEGVLNVELGGTVTVGSRMGISEQGVVNLYGGQIVVGEFDFTGGVFNFAAGTVRVTADANVNRTLADTLLGPTHTLGTVQHWAIDGTAALNTWLVLDGGTLSVGRLENASLLHASHGVLNVANQALVIETGGLLGETLDLAPDMTYNIVLGTTNRGLVTGDGRIDGPFHNDAGGELRAEPGRSLTLTGIGNTNRGRVQLLGGLLDFTQNLTNDVGGYVSGNGTLRSAKGLVNKGVMSFSGLSNVVGDVTNDAGGLIVASGGGPTTFFDDVVNRGEIRTSDGSYAVFFGAVSGVGSFTGLGTVNFEGDLNPGASPAIVDFGGDLVMGPAASLIMEIGGTTPGAAYDQLRIAGSAAWNGTLVVELIDGFSPIANQKFVLATYDSGSSAFDAVALAELPEGLAWDLNYGQTGLTLTVTSTSLPGDIDLDGDVDRTDAALFSRYYGRLGDSIWTTGDFDGDSATTVADLNLLQSHLGQSVISAPSAAAVPEPSTVLMLQCGLGVFANSLARRIRRRSKAARRVRIPRTYLGQQDRHIASH